MKKIFGLLGFLFLVSPLTSAQTPSTKQKPLVLTHVTVIDTTGGPSQQDMTVVIRGERIAAMGKSGKVRVPPGSEVVDATGKFLIPGLWDMDVLWYEPNYLPLFIANGVTGARITIGYAENYKWRNEVEAARLLGPRMVVASRWFDGPEAVGPYFLPITSAKEASQAVINAQKYGADLITLGGGETLPREAFFAVADEAKSRGIPFEGAVPVGVSIAEASNAGMKSIEEQPSMFGLEMILSACSSREAELMKSWQNLATDYKTWQTFWEGPRYRAPMQLALDSYDKQKAEALFAVLKANHTWFCPALCARRNTTFLQEPSIAHDPRLKYMSAAEREWWRYMRVTYAKTFGSEGIALRKQMYEKELEIVGAMRRAGVEFLAGTTTEDPLFAVPGFSLHDELALLVQAGFTPLEALQTATLNPARFLGRERAFGTVAPGKFADLVLLDANPLEDIGNTRKIAAVIYRGKFHSRASLDTMLKNVETLANRKAIGDVLEATVKEKGVETAIRQYRQLKATQPDSYAFDDIYDTLGGEDLLKAKKVREAIQMFALSAEAYPRWQIYDHLGDTYLQAGDKKLAIQSFERSLELDPAQAYAAIKLKQLNAH